MPLQWPELSFQKIDPAGRLDQVGEGAALAARVAIALLHVRRDLGAERTAVQHLHAALDAQRALLVRDAEVAEAGIVRGAAHGRPDAGVQAREDAHADSPARARSARRPRPP